MGPSVPNPKGWILARKNIFSGQTVNPKKKI
jgi:hypothetical protein